MYNDIEYLKILTPVGRLVSGSLYEGQTHDYKTKAQLMTKEKVSGQGGLPKTVYFFALAIPKQGEAHWNQTAWGKQIYEFGKAKFPTFFQRGEPTNFSWKVDDGDSTEVNKNAKTLAEKEGHPGNWILSFSSNLVQHPNGTFTGKGAPDIYHQKKLLEQKGYVNKGDFIRVSFTASKNSDSQGPALYLNVGGVEFICYGPRIQGGYAFDPDAEFSEPYVLPAGGSLVPLASETFDLDSDHPQETPPHVIAQAKAEAAAAQVPAQITVTPHAAALMPPPPALDMPAPPAIPVMSPDCPYTYEQLAASKWTDAQMRQKGYLI